MLDDEKKHLIERYFDSQLDESGVADAMRLLEQSDEARQYYAELKAMAEQAEGLMLDGGDDFWQVQKDSILDRIDAANEKKIVPVKPANKFLRLRTLAVAASLILVGVITVYEVRQNPDFNRPIEQETIKPIISKGADTIADYVNNESAVGEIAEAPEGEAEAVDEDETVQSPVPAPVADIVLTADKPPIRSEEGPAEIPALTEPQREKKLDISGSNLVQPSIRHDEITLEQGREALDRGRTEESAEQAVMAEPEPRDGVGIKPKELAKPETGGIIAETSEYDVDDLLEMAFDNGDSSGGKINIRGPRVGVDKYYEVDALVSDRADDSALSEMGVSIAVRGSVGVDSLAYWSRRMDSLELVSAETDSPHYRMAVGKATRQAATAGVSQVDSLRWYYAEAIYKTAALSPDSVDVQPYLDKLSGLKAKSRDSLAETIARYMTELEAREK